MCERSATPADPLPSFGQIAAELGSPASSPRRRASSETLVGDVPDSRASSVTAIGEDEGEAQKAPLVTFDDDEDGDGFGAKSMGADSSFVFEAVEPVRGGDDDRERVRVDERTPSAASVGDDEIEGKSDTAALVGDAASDDDDMFAFEVVDRQAMPYRPPSIVDDDDQIFVDDDAARMLDNEVEPVDFVAQPVAPVAGPSRPRQARRESPASLSPAPIPAAAKGKGKARARDFATARPAAQSPEPSAPFTAEQIKLMTCLKKGKAAAAQLKLAEAKQVRLLPPVALIAQWYRKALEHGLSHKNHDKLVADLPAPGRGGAIAVDLPAAKPRRRESSSPRRPTWHASAATAPTRGKRRAPSRR